MALKGTAANNKMMESMDTYGGQSKPGYHPPSGSAGREAKGMHSHDKNPLSVPRKGSDIGAGYGNADRMKAMGLKDQQIKKESLRGMAC
jgi:hypothetical protein